MFALAIWDSEKKHLILARDRAGIKPLYYSVDSGRILFASEIKTLTKSLGSKAVDPSALNLFLKYRYTPSPHTIFKGIKKLAPGTVLVAKNGDYSIKRWWNFRPEPFDPQPTIQEAESTLIDLYTSALKRHMISDVPVGLLLSGGLDSGLMAALLKQAGQNVDTFSVGYGSSFKDDEIDDARSTANHYEMNNFSVKLTRNTFEQNLQRIISCLEEPVATSSIVPMYFLCEKTREHVKVALMGQGPDELFGGYKRHLGIQYGSILRSVPSPLVNLASNFANHITRNEAIRRAFHSLNDKERISRYVNVFSLLPGREIDNLFYPGLLSQNSDELLYSCWKDFLPLIENTDELGGFQAIEIRSSLPDELLMYADKLSMNHSLEVRLPYLDKEIIEYVERLSSHFKVRYFKTKWLHRRVCSRIMPKDLINRRKKGFATNVVDAWFKDSLSKYFDDILSDGESLIYGMLKRDSVLPLLREHKNGRSDYHKILFSLIVLEMWMREFGN